MSKTLYVHIALEVEDDMSAETLLDSLLGIFPSVDGNDNHIAVRERDALDDFPDGERGRI